MANLSNKTVLVYDDSGSYTHVAERLAKDFGRVLYHTQWQTGFSDATRFLPGIGLDGIERIADPYEVMDEFDVAVFCDVGHGALQEHWRDEGIPVWGCGRADKLELDRWFLKQTLNENGMLIADTRLVVGIDQLQKILEKEKDLYVKFSYFRAISETFHHKQWFTTQSWFDDLRSRLGPYGKIQNFVVEEPIEDGDAIEVGYDGFAVKGVRPKAALWGYEVKDAGYIGTTDPLPFRLQETTDSFLKILKKYNYSGAFSTEVRVTKDDDYLIDPTLRFPSPPSEIECALMTNFSEVIYGGAHGRLIEPEYSHRYGVELILKSDWVIEHSLPIKFDNPERVAVHGHYVIDGKHYAVVVEEFCEFGAAVGLGDTLEDAIAEAFEVAEGVSAYQLRYSESAFDEAMETIKKGERLGLAWTNPTIKRKIA